MSNIHNAHFLSGTKTWFLATALFIALLPTQTCFAQDENALQSLNAMHNAQHQLDYEYTFIQANNNDVDSLRYRHIHYNGQTYAQLINLEGIKQEIIQRHNDISYFQPNQAFSLHGNYIVDNLPSLLNANIGQINKHYDFINLGRNRIADRLVQAIRILPKDHFRYQYVIFLDEDTHLLLGSDMLDRDGNVLERFRVVNLYVGDQLKPLAEYLNNINLPPQLNTQTNNEKSTFHWQPSWLPEGFVKINQNSEKLADDYIENQLYSDGLCSFSIAVSSKILPNEQENVWKQGAYTIYSETLKDHEVTVIGQIPLTTAKRIVQDIKFTQ